MSKPTRFTQLRKAVRDLEVAAEHAAAAEIILPQTNVDRAAKTLETVRTNVHRIIDEIEQQQKG